MLTVEAVGGGDQAQQEDQDAGGQGDPDQGAAGTWKAGGDMVWMLSTQHHPALAALGDGAWGGKGRKASQVLRGRVEDMTIALGYPLEDALHLKALQGT